MRSPAAADIAPNSAVSSPIPSAGCGPSRRPKPNAVTSRGRSPGRGCDLDLTTDKRGRPYTLVCTKNQASYDRRAKQRKQDLEDLARLDP